MTIEKLEDLTHLTQYRLDEESYQILLATAKSTLKKCMTSLVFQAEDLWARHQFFGVIGGRYIPPKGERRKEWDSSLNPFRNDRNRDSHEVIIIQLIRSFLLYAVEREDAIRTPLITANKSENGFSFMEKPQAEKQHQTSPPKK